MLQVAGDEVQVSSAPIPFELIGHNFAVKKVNPSAHIHSLAAHYLPGGGVSEHTIRSWGFCDFGWITIVVWHVLIDGVSIKNGNDESQRVSSCGRKATTR